MKILERTHIDIEKWNRLVQSNPEHSVFSLSHYMDAVAEQWCVLVNEAYTAGMALPYTIRLGVKCCYTPTFVRYVEFLGDEQATEAEIVQYLQTHFRIGQLCVRCSPAFPATTSSTFIYQTIEATADFSLNTQAKRMVAKFEKTGLKLMESNEEATVLHIISRELPQKIASINEQALSTLKQLVAALKQQGLVRIMEVKDAENSTQGGVFLVKFNTTVLYLKGAFSESAKKQGAMYALMHQAIQTAQAQGNHFDFGGSRVENVRRFNANLGGKDVAYKALTWDNGPRWFRWLKQFKSFATTLKSLTFFKTQVRSQQHNILNHDK